MKIGNIIVLKDGVVEKNIAIVASDNDTVNEGVYKGETLSDALEEEFIEQCSEIDPSLPAAPDDAGNNYPDVDGGVWTHGNMTVCLTTAEIA